MDDCHFGYKPKFSLQSPHPRLIRSPLKIMWIWIWVLDVDLEWQFLLLTREEADQFHLRSDHVGFWIVGVAEGQDVREKKKANQPFGSLFCAAAVLCCCCCSCRKNDGWIYLFIELT
jgi:hypothetical protein